MENRMHIVLFLSFASFFNFGNACSMEGVTLWPIPISEDIQDIFTGTVVSRTTTNIDGISSFTFGEGMAGGPYLNVEHSNNQFRITTNENYTEFEEHEVSASMSVTVVFSCTGGGTETLLVLVNVIDTNNNYPVFLPTSIDEYEFVVTPPLLPGYLLTGCSRELIVRDIDLTTYRIDFAIQDNPYIEIEYDEVDSDAIDRKQFKATLRTTSFIRTLEEPLTLWISATDVDRTGNDPKTTTTTLRIVPDTDFIFPQEPIFSETFYLADYTEDHQLIMFETIYLRQGYDDYVDFKLEGEYFNHFNLTLTTNNQITIVSLNTLPLGNISENQIHLVLRAEREYTSGDTATVIIRLPEIPPLSFEKQLYEGKIEDKIFEAPPLVLSQGYENKIVTAEVVGEYSEFFTAVVEGNVVTLTMRGETDDVIRNNNFISLQVRASTDDSESTTILSLDIIKDDNVTPVFDKPIYNGAYDPVTGLTVEQIVFIQGSDDIHTVELLGEHREYFDIDSSVTDVITITSTGIPEKIFDEQNIILSIKASKLRTVGANAAIIISLPAAKELEFEEPFYKRTIQDNIMALQDILLRDSYEGTLDYTLRGELQTGPDESFSKIIFEGVLQNDIVSHETITLSEYTGTEVELFGEYSSLFEATLSNNAVTITARNPLTLPDGLTHLSLELHAGIAKAVLLLNVETPDTPIESFSKLLFEGTISNDNVDHESILLSGYTGTEVELVGEYSSLFEAILSNNAVTITARNPLTLPDGLPHLTLQLQAGLARAVLILNIETPNTPIESFSKLLFEGTLSNDIVNHETILLAGYTGTEIELFGEYSSLFEATLSNSAVTITARNPLTLPDGLTHLTLELQSGIARAILLINIENNDTPIGSDESFSKIFYEGVIQNDIVNHETITLSGYNGTEVELFGAYATLFEAVLSNNVVTVSTRSSATLPTGVSHFTLELEARIARAILLLYIENTDTPTESNESFDKLLYEGVIQNDIVIHEAITLSGYSGTEAELFGEHASLFEAVLSNNAVIVNTRPSVTLPIGITHLTVELRAGTARAVLLLNFENTDTPTESNESFSKVLFEGVIQNDIVNHETISLFGFSGSEIELFGEYASLFEAVLTNNAVIVNKRSSVTLPTGLTHLTLELRAGTARAVLLLNFENTDTPIGSDEYFSKLLFEGVIRNDIVNHEIITLSGYSGSEVELFGEYAALFEAVLSSNEVTINTRVSVILPEGLTHLTLELRAGTARAVLLLNIENADSPVETNESFSKVLFEGDLRNGIVDHETITLFGYSGSEVELVGEYASLFEAVLTNNAVTVNTRSSVTLPTGLTHLTLELRAGTARAVLLLNFENIDTPIGSDESFSKVLFEGVIRNGIVSHEIITLSGYSGSEVELFGEYAILFEAVLSNNAVTINTRSSVTLPAELTHLTLELQAGIARAVLLLNVDNTDPPVESNESFSKILYEGDIRNGVVDHEPITLFGYSGTEVGLFGEYSSLFEALLVNNAVSVNTRSAVTLPMGLNHLTLELRAGTARAVLILNIESTDTPIGTDESFSKVLFEGVIRDDVVSHEIITLSGYSGTEVELFGEYATLFEAVLTNNAVTVNTRSSVTLPTGLTHLTLELRAGTARAVLLLNFENIDTPPVGSDESFSKAIYKGVIRNDIVIHEIITLTGYSGTEVQLLGEYASLFEAVLSNNAVIVNTRSSVTLPTGITYITLDLRAGNAIAVLLLNFENTDTPIGSDASFSKVLFEGIIQNDIVNHEIITLSGYSGTEIELFGEYASLFEAVSINNAVTVNTRSAVTLPTGITHLTLELRAGTARAVLLLNFENTDSPIGSDESFTKVLFEGVIINNIVNHETITLSGYSGTEVELLGEYASLFEAVLSNNAVTINTRSSVTLPAGLTHLTLELRAGTARAVLLLNIENTEAPVTPVVTFSAESYSIRVDITQTGLVGQVRATADSGEPINYSLQLDNSHLEERLSINNIGELHLSAPVSGGLYAFRVVGTTAFTQAVGTATVHLSVEAVTVCGDNLVMPPLITLDRDEEEPHHDLLNGTQYEGCHFSIANRWPLDQTWLYVDDTGLHTRAIDREHESIAFMPLSQVQVEITLHCDNDDTRVKRSLNSDSLGPYDYGPSKWILTDSILYNSRKTLFNLIVNDINDNTPIFDDKPNEPIAVGYPIPELEDVVLPRSLTQLHATDADIGENAAIVYSSPNSELAVAPLTGFVHVRNGARLEQNAAMTVHATDRNGQGNRGSINLIVKLLDQSNIAVVTIRDAFLDDEASVVSYLSDAVGYDVKVLRSVVVSQEEEIDDNRRTKRETTNGSGASLELYIYGIRERDPVEVERLTTDISNAASTITVNLANIVSLEDHLEGLEICAIMERDTGLLVATIVLSVLLFAVIVLIAIWSFLKWRKNTYQKFEDTNSAPSRSESIDQIPKPEILPKARINPDELMRSERRLQEILDTPIEAITVEPIPAAKSLPASNDLIELTPSPELNTPIVIQSIDKLKDPADDISDDEFGEIKQPRRKSVVTFNENVEKIIHVEDNEDSEDVTSDPDLEVYKF